MHEDIARPGDPDLDTHLSGLRLTSVTRTSWPGMHADLILQFSLDDAGGWWADEKSGRRRTPGGGMSFMLAAGMELLPGCEGLADDLTADLQHWAHSGAFIEMTSAPGRFTMLRSGRQKIFLPRSGEPVTASGRD